MFRTSSGQNNEVSTFGCAPRFKIETGHGLAGAGSRDIGNSLRHSDCPPGTCCSSEDGCPIPGGYIDPAISGGIIDSSHDEMFLSLCCLEESPLNSVSITPNRQRFGGKATTPIEDEYELGSMLPLPCNTGANVRKPQGSSLRERQDGREGVSSRQRGVGSKQLIASQ